MEASRNVVPVDSSLIFIGRDASFYALLDVYQIIKGHSIVVTGDPLEVMITAINGQLFKMIQGFIVLYRLYMPVLIRFFKENPMYAAVIAAAIARYFGIIPLGGNRKDRIENK